MRNNQNTKGRVFIFCRPYLVPDYEANIRPIREEYDFIFLTDGWCRGVRDTRKRFYERLLTSSRPTTFSLDDEDDMVERCRYLRNLPRKKATPMLWAMASILDEELSEYEPDVVLSHMVDDYITHLLAELARRRGIKFLGVAYSYFPGMAQITEFGNGIPFNFREPSENETAEILHLISQRKFRQNYKQKDTYTKFRHAKAIFRYHLKKIVFQFLRWYRSDPLHMHYAALPYVVERRRWSDFPKRSDFHRNWRERIATAKLSNGKPIIYFPLGYFPEATIDYWISNRNILNYQYMVKELCIKLGGRFNILVKEHLHMLGARNPDFYRDLLDIPEITSIPPMEYSNDALDLSDIVLIGGGSIGVESFIRGKPIATFCKTSYWFPYSGAALLNLDDLDSWPDFVWEALNSYKPPDNNETFEFIRNCLQSTLRDMGTGRVWPICHPDDLNLALKIAINQ